MVTEVRSGAVQDLSVPGAADPAYRPGQLVSVQGVDELAAAVLRPSDGVHDASGHLGYQVQAP